MTLATLAVKHVRHQLRQYAAFFLSSAFAAWLFYLYGALLLHPDFAPDKVPDLVRATLLGVEGVVALFAVLFTVHAHSAFLRARQKELGLLGLLGVAPRQLSGILLLENALVGLGATTAGVLLGMVCSRLFFLAIGAALDLAVPFKARVSLGAVGLTYGTFALIFGLISVMGHVKLRRLDVAELLRGARRPPAPPRTSPWLAMLCLFSLGAAYWLGLVRGQEALGRWLWLFLPALLLGTYLLFAQAGVALVGGLQRLRPLYWRGTNLFTLSQMAAKLRSNVRVLFMVTIISSIAMTAAGLNYSGLAQAAESAAEWNPVHIMLEGEAAGVGPARVREVLAQHGLAPVRETSVPVLWAELGESAARVLVVSATNFSRWAGPVAVPNHQAVLVGPELSVPLATGASEITLTFGADGVTLPVGARQGRLAFNLLGSVVVDDATFAELQARFGAARGLTIHGFALPDWAESGPAVTQLLREIGPEARSPVRLPGPLWTGHLTATHDFYASNKLLNSLGLFLTSFIGLLFLLAAGNMLYFKLLHDLQEDRPHFHALNKLGLGAREVRRIVSIQTLVLFFAPLAVAAAHVTMLQSIAANALHVSVWRPVGVVTGVYALLQAGYYLVARRTYVRALMDQE